MDAAKGILPRIFSLLCSPFLSLCVSTSTFRSDLAPASGRCVTVRTGAGVFFPSSQHSRFLFAAEVFSLSLSALSMALFSEAPDLAWSSRWWSPMLSAFRFSWSVPLSSLQGLWQMEETDLLISQGSVVWSSIFLFLDGEVCVVLRDRLFLVSWKTLSVYQHWEI